MSDPFKASEVEGRLEKVNSYQDGDDKHSYDHHHDGNEKLRKLDEHMKKYDADGDGIFSPEEVRNIVRDMESAEKEAKNMGRIALGVGLGSLVLCLALIGLMVAANEASKENHIEKGVNRDLDGNPVMTKGLQSFAAMRDIPTLSSSTLNELTYLSFTAIVYAQYDLDLSSVVKYNMRFSVSSWLRQDTTKDVTLFSQDGAIIVIKGSSACASATGQDCMTLTTLEGGVSTPYVIVSDASEGRRLLGKNAMHCSNKLFTSVEKMHQCMFGGEASRRLAAGDTTSYLSVSADSGEAGDQEYELFNQQCATCQNHFMPYDSFDALPVERTTCKCPCQPSGTGPTPGRRLEEAAGSSSGSSSGATENSLGEECCACSDDPDGPRTETIQFYRTDNLGGSASPGMIQRDYYNSQGAQGYCYNLVYFTGPDATCTHPDAYAGMACANIGTPEEMYCNPDISTGACARCQEDPDAPFVPSPIARRQRRALTTRQRRQRARGRAVARRVLHIDPVSHNHTGSCANACGGPGIAPPGQTSDCNCGNTCEAFDDCCADFTVQCAAIVSVDFTPNGDVYTFSDDGITDDSNLVGTQGTLFADGTAAEAALDASSVWAPTYSNTTTENAPDYEYEVYDDNVDYDTMCNQCEYSAPNTEEPDEVYAFDVRFGGIDHGYAANSFDCPDEVCADGGAYPTEIQWTIEGGANHKLVDEPYEWNWNMNQYELEQDVKVQMKVGAHTLLMFDAYGDGWNAAEWQLYHWNTNNPVLGFDADGGLAPITCSFEFTGDLQSTGPGNAHHDSDTHANDADAFGHPNAFGRHLQVSEERKLISKTNRRQLHFAEGCDTSIPGKCGKCEFSIPPEALLENMYQGAGVFDSGYVLATEAVTNDDAGSSNGASSGGNMAMPMPSMMPTGAPTCNWVCA